MQRAKPALTVSLKTRKPVQVKTADRTTEKLDHTPVWSIEDRLMCFCPPIPYDSDNGKIILITLFKG